MDLGDYDFKVMLFVVREINKLLELGTRPLPKTVKKKKLEELYKGRVL